MCSGESGTVVDSPGEQYLAVQLSISLGPRQASSTWCEQYQSRPLAFTKPTCLLMSCLLHCCAGSQTQGRTSTLPSLVGTLLPAPHPLSCSATPSKLHPPCMQRGAQGFLPYYAHICPWSWSH
jgi:hypothetical protein